MRLYITPCGEDIFEMAWDESARIPVAGELILDGPDVYRVDIVQWELEEDGLAVQLRVVRQ